MALAVDGSILFYTCLSGAMLQSWLSDSGVDFTYSLLKLDFRVSITQVPVIVKVLENH